MSALRDLLIAAAVKTVFAWAVILVVELSNTALEVKF